MKTYKARGCVWGATWGGGESGFAAENIEANTLPELRKQVYTGIKEGWLDAGMGFQSLLGAIMEIIETDTRIIDGKAFTHKTRWFERFGPLPEEVVKQIVDVMYANYGCDLAL